MRVCEGGAGAPPDGPDTAPPRTLNPEEAAGPGTGSVGSKVTEQEMGGRRRLCHVTLSSRLSYANPRAGAVANWAPCCDACSRQTPAMTLTAGTRRRRHPGRQAAPLISGRGFSEDAAPEQLRKSARQAVRKHINTSINRSARNSGLLLRSPCYRDNRSL